MLTSIAFFGQPVSWIELIAVVSGLAGVWLTVRKNVLCFPVGILNVLLYAFLFFSPDVRLYADAVLQLFFGVLLLYGWASWKKNKMGDEIRIERTRKIEWLVIVLFISILTLTAGWLLHRFTAASFPILDTALTAVSLIAQWMTARRKLENWWLWVVVDIIYVPLYWTKGLPFTALLYVLFAGLAVNGAIAWRKTFLNQTP